MKMHCTIVYGDKTKGPLLGNYVEFIAICFLFDSDISLKCVARIAVPLDRYPVRFISGTYLPYQCFAWFYSMMLTFR
jgi:hypothetical protein